MAVRALYQALVSPGFSHRSRRPCHRARIGDRLRGRAHLLQSRATSITKPRPAPRLPRKTNDAGGPTRRPPLRAAKSTRGMAAFATESSGRLPRSLFVGPSPEGRARRAQYGPACCDIRQDFCINCSVVPSPARFCFCGARIWRCQAGHPFREVPADQGSPRRRSRNGRCCCGLSLRIVDDKVLSQPRGRSRSSRMPRQCQLEPR